MGFVFRQIDLPLCTARPPVQSAIPVMSQVQRSDLGAILCSCIYFGICCIVYLLHTLFRDPNHFAYCFICHPVIAHFFYKGVSFPIFGNKDIIIIEIRPPHFFSYAIKPNMAFMTQGNKTVYFRNLVIPTTLFSTLPIKMVNIKRTLTFFPFFKTNLASIIVSLSCLSSRMLPSCSIHIYSILHTLDVLQVDNFTHGKLST